MKESKYIELLRYYLFEKLDESSKEYDNSQAEFIIEIISTVFSALVSSLFADAFVSQNSGSAKSYISLTLILSVTYFGLRKLSELILKRIQSIRKTASYAKKKLDAATKQKYISKFDNIACDGLILSYDFLAMHSERNASMVDINLREFYLFEAFYYYKKAIDSVALLLEYRNDCVGCSGGVSMYRIINVYNTLKDIESELNNHFTAVYLKDKSDLQSEIKIYEMRLHDIEICLGITK